MRRIIVIAVSLFSCGQSSLSAAAAGAPVAETQAQYLARCTSETIAANPQSRNWAQDNCKQNWETVAAAGPMAEAILAAAPATAGAVDLAAVRGRVTQVRWSGGASGATLASGQLGRDLAVSLTRTPPMLGFTWDSGGDIVPYDVVEALKSRGATLTLVACQSYGGPIEVVRVYNVTAPGRALFGLSVYGHNAAVAGAYAAYQVTLYLTGQPATLASVRRLGQSNEEWAATCPS
jgi:hypothetical protein